MISCLAMLIFFLFLFLDWRFI